jgi:hypothetical protein
MHDDIQKRPGSAIRWLLSLLAMFYLGHAAANECLNLLPYDTVADGLPKICQSAYNGIADNYSCQDYRSGQNHYRVLYRGGNIPKAVLTIHSDGSEQLMSSPVFGDPKLRCPLNSPAGVPKYANHRGTGVCLDENDKPIACSIYLHAAARETEAHRYMVFYPNQREDKVHIEVQTAGNNKDAMVAELAFQIGMSLWDTECCSAEAVKYFAFAHQLFPRAEAYRKAYQRGRALVAFKDN